MDPVKLLERAVQESLPSLTSSLRANAYRQGWKADCGRSLVVSCDEDSLSVEMSDAAEALEFGWGSQPQPAVRTWSNNVEEFESILAESIDRVLSEVL
jgi:hypothetical protein